jgi:hypothetical protein
VFGLNMTALVFVGAFGSAVFDFRVKVSCVHGGNFFSVCLKIRFN